MSTVPVRSVTPQEYLERERAATDGRSEYFAGEVFAMAGASREHNRVVRNLGGMLYVALRDGPCEHFQTDMRVKVTRTGLYTYPDVVVTCEHPEFEDVQLDTLLNPQVVVEVVSPSTESFDRGRKFHHYQLVPSLREYLLVSQDEPRIERYLRQDDGSWRLDEAVGLDATLRLTAVGVALPLCDVYEKVTFPPRERRADAE
ncbi:MAG: Uma2 family endonuclease [Lacipirellulaceae bacterium]